MELKIRENFISYITEKIMPKAKFNEQTGRYEIKYEDYKNFNLSCGEKKLLKKICTNMGIDLESRGYLREPLICIEDESLFKEYNNIKEQLETNITSEEKIKLEQRKNEIINRIVIDNIPFIQSIINHRIADIENREDKEDIYQAGYEMLINYIHQNYLYKGKFKDTIGQQIIIYITRNLLPNTDNEYEKPNTKNTDEETLIDIISKKQIISIIISTLQKREQDILNLYYGFNGIEYTTMEISKMYGITKQEISNIIINSLETIRNSIRIKYLNEIYDESIIYECKENKENKKLEEFLIKKLPKEFLDEILKDLKGRYKQVADLYFSDKDYSISEIASLIKIRESNTSTTKNKVILYIRNQIIKIIEEEYHKNFTYEEYLEYLKNIYQHQSKLKRGR